jgi:sec-independent protein translocase protein TatA
MSPLFAFFDNPAMLLVIGAIAVMLLGERLPEVARSFGKGFMELKKGVRNIQDDVEGAIRSATSIDAPAARPEQSAEPEDRQESTVPKFEPPPAP